MLKRVTIRSIILTTCFYAWFEYSKIWYDKTIPAYANPTIKYGGIWRFLTIQNFFLHLVVNSLLLFGEILKPGKLLGNFKD